VVEVPPARRGGRSSTLTNARSAEKIQVYNKRQTNIPLVTEARRRLETKHPADLKRLETSVPNAARLPALFAVQKSRQESTTRLSKLVGPFRSFT
jgi:hypothetical protein